MILLPPRPRFYLIVWSQLVGVFMIVLGMLPYWLRFQHARIGNPSVSWRTGTAALVLFLMFIVPLAWNRGVRDFEEMADEDQDETRNDSERLADNPVTVRRIIWIYCLIDLFILTYLVYVTGGMTGSMYAGLYLLVPSLALLLMLGSADLSRAIWLIFWAIVGIALSFLMNFSGFVLWDANTAHKQAYNVALSLVSLLGASQLIIQVAILKFQFEKRARQAQQLRRTPVIESQSKQA